MKKILILLFVLIGGTFANAQDIFQKQQVEVLPESQLTITGDTNIKGFTCNFDTSFLKGPQIVSYGITGSTIKFTNAVLVLDNLGFDCGNRGINKDFNGLIKSDKYPEILLEIKEMDLHSDTRGMARVKITIAGMERFYKVPVAINNTEIAEFKGKLELDINDFGLEPPNKLFGIIKVKDDIQINFDLRIKLQN